MSVHPAPGGTRIGYELPKGDRDRIADAEKVKDQILKQKDGLAPVRKEFNKNLMEKYAKKKGKDKSDDFEKG